MIKRTCTVLLAATLLVSGIPTFAQDSPPQGGFDSQAVARKLASMLGSESDLGQYEASLARLEQASQAFTPAEAKKALELLKSKELTVEQAEAQFDQMIKDIEESQALGDPNGEFVSFMNKMTVKAGEEARAAIADGDKKYGDAFTALSEEFKSIRDRAVDARNQAIPAIDFVKQNKRKLVRAIKLRAFAEIAQIADEAVTKVAQQSGAVIEIAKGMSTAADRLATPR